MYLRKLIFSFLLLQLSASAVAIENAETLKIYIIDIDRPSTIISRKILTLAYQELGVPIEFVSAPVARGARMWRDGGIDAMFFRVHTTGLPDAIKIPVPIVYEEGVVYTTKQRFKVAGYDSLKPYTVGYIANVAYLKEKLKDVPKKDSAPNLDSLFRMLAAGRTDVAVESRYTQCVAKKWGLNEIVMLEPSLDSAFGYHSLHERRRSLAAPLEKVLKEMEKNGSIKRIQDQVMLDFTLQCPSSGIMK